MSDRFSYSNQWSGGNEPWFRVGRVDVTTTVALISLGILSVFIWVAEGPRKEFSRKILLDSDKVAEGEIWRLITWPLVNEPSIWTIFLFFILYLLGNQLENLMGRRPFMFFLLMLTVLPGAAVFLYGLGDSPSQLMYGLRYVELGVLIAFAAQYPTARFWPGVPAYGIVGVIYGLDILQALSVRSGSQLIMLIAVAATALIGFRSFGYANDLHWLPKIRLPALITGNISARRSRTSRRSSKRRHLKLEVLNEKRESSAEREIDKILDQVAESGINSLSKNQRKKLEEHSKKLRKERGD
jgi:membrane associated rhomboid family serine protease